MKLIILTAVALSSLMTGCQTQPADSINILGNTITYQHKKDRASIEKTSLDATNKCIDLGYAKSRVSHTSCSNECVTSYICE